MKLVSIIVPIYNVEHFLRECIDSLINQTYTNLELIFVNDASPDNSKDIILEYAKNDSRIVLVDNEQNLGLCGSKRKAEKLAKGDVIMYCDGDDYYAKDTVEKAISKMEEENADLVFFSYYRLYPDRVLEKKIVGLDSVYDEEGCKLLTRRLVGLVGEELSNPELNDAFCSMVTCAYTSEIIKKSNPYVPHNNEIGSFDDGLFNLQVFPHAKKAVFINECLYYYRKFNMVSITTAYRPKMLEQWTFMYSEIERHIITFNLGEEAYSALENRKALDMLGLGLNALKIGKKKEQIKEIKRILSLPYYEKAVKTLETKYMPIHWRLFYNGCKKKKARRVRFLLKMIERLKSRV